MDFLSLYDVSERRIELVNPSSPEKIIAAGEALGLAPGKRVIEFGSGYAEVLLLWADRFEISGVGIEIREKCCERARKKIAEASLDDRLEIVCMAGAEYEHEPNAFDVGACIGASFVWGGYRPALVALKKTIRSGGRIVVGEPYWRHDPPPEALRKKEGFHTEPELLEIAREEGLTIASIHRSDEVEWDGYETANWRGLLAWLDENAVDHPDRPDVLKRLRDSQDEYVGWTREHCGWAIYTFVSNPA